MAVEETELAAVHAEPFPHPVAEHEPAVEHRHHCLSAWLELAVDVDQDRRVPRVRDIVHRLRHRATVQCTMRLGNYSVVFPSHSSLGWRRSASAWVDCTVPSRC